jgi:hypothetical protein
MGILLKVGEFQPNCFTGFGYRFKSKEIVGVVSRGTDIGVYRKKRCFSL